MKFPCLVDKRFCKTPIHIEIYSEDTDRYGQPVTIYSSDLLCNYQSSAKRVLNEKKELIQLTAQAYFVGDICPEIPQISNGTVIIGGIKRDILQGCKALNPDGTVNFTRIDII